MVSSANENLTGMAVYPANEVDSVSGEPTSNANFHRNNNDRDLKRLRSKLVQLLSKNSPSLKLPIEKEKKRKRCEEEENGIELPPQKKKCEEMASSSSSNSSSSPDEIGDDDLFGMNILEFVTKLEEMEQNKDKKNVNNSSNRSSSSSSSSGSSSGNNVALPPSPPPTPSKSNTIKEKTSAETALAKEMLSKGFKKVHYFNASTLLLFNMKHWDPPHAMTKVNVYDSLIVKS